MDESVIKLPMLEKASTWEASKFRDWNEKSRYCRTKTEGENEDASA